MIDIYPGYSEPAKKGAGNFFQSLNELIKTDIIPFSCARAAMNFGLRESGLSRMDEILVPPYLGQCVLSALSRTVFPSMTPNFRTRSILVYHQFGFPQHLDSIEKMAKQNNWIILNDCANTIFSTYKESPVINWGDFTVLSFSKLFPCVLGGAFLSKDNTIKIAINKIRNEVNGEHAKWVKMAYATLEREKKHLLNGNAEFEIDAVFGYLPGLVSFPVDSFQLLPDATTEIETDIQRRQYLFKIVRSYFPDQVPKCAESDVVPFAIPVRVEKSQLSKIHINAIEKLSVEVPVLHFDYNRNMLDSDYAKSLVIGCHSEWTEGLVIEICELIKKG